MSCDCGHFNECAKGKAGLCWQNAETMTLTAQQLDTLLGLLAEE